MQSKFCANCGAAVQDGVKFCARCGAPIPAENATAAAQRQAGAPAPPPVYAQPQVNARQPASMPYAQSAYVPAPKKRAGVGKILLIILGCFVAFIAIIVIIANLAVGSTANADSVKLGKDEIASVKAIVGKRSISSTRTETSGGVTTKAYVYNEIENVQQDLMDYAYYLRNDEGFIVTIAYDLNTFPGTFQLARQSVDDGKVIILDVEYDANGYTLVFTKGDGTFEAY